MDDKELLAAYVREGSDRAFRELVERHGGLVLGAARRQLGETSLAEDVAQAVFTLLARKAGTLGANASVAGWLWRTTCYVAARAKRSEMRRQKREQEALAMQDLNQGDDSWKRLEPELDQALGRLNRQQQAAVLLHYVESRSHREVAHDLGISEEAAKKQAQRGLEAMRRFFARSGRSVSAVTLVMALAHAGKAQASAEWAAGVAGQALAQGSGAGEMALLAEETLRAWRFAKLQMAAVGVVVLLGVVMLVHQMVKPSAKVETAQPVAGVAAATQTPVVRKVVPEAPKTPKAQKVLRLRVVAAESGEGIGYANLAVNRVVGGDWRRQTDLVTDASGSAEIELPSGCSRLDVGVAASGYVSRFGTWVQDRNPIPQEHTLKLERADRWMGGWVRDEHQQPLAGVVVKLESWTTGDAAFRETPSERIGVPFETPVATTDAQGRWRCAVLPTSGHGGFTLSAHHPDYRVVTIASADRHESAPEAGTQSVKAGGSGTRPRGESLRQLWNQQLVTVMDQGITLQGTVYDPAGLPVAGAKVMHSPHAVNELRAETGADGTFQFAQLDPGETFDVAVMAEGYAPAYVKVTLQGEAGVQRMQIRLQAGASLRLRVVDEDGQPVQGVYVGLEQWGERRHVIRWGATSDANGAVEWQSAPIGEKLELYATKNGWCMTRDIVVKAGEEEHVVRMRRALTLRGRVTDAQTGDAVTQFKAFPGYGTGEYRWERLETRRSTNGEYKVTFAENRSPWQLRVEAEGYEPWESEAIDPKDGDRLDVALQRADPQSAVEGVVLGPDGKPAQAEVALLTTDHNVEVVPEPARFESHSGENLLLHSDAKGHFRFAPHGKAHSVAAVNASGFGWALVDPSNREFKIQLLRWGRIEGRVLPEARRRPVASVMVSDPLARLYGGHVGWSTSRLVSSVQEDGTFVLERVPVLPCALLLTHGPNQMMTHRTPVVVIPGQTLQVEIGCVGHTVRGRVVLQGGAPLEAVTNGYVYVGPIDHPEPKPPVGLTGLAALQWPVRYWNSDEGLERARREIGHYPKLSPDGSFEVEQLVPGEYKLRISVKQGNLTRQLTVPSDQPPCASLDLGVLELE